MTSNPTSRYPDSITLDGRSLDLRLMDGRDIERVLAFARTLQPHDLLFLRRDITQPEQLDLWVRNIDAGLMTTVLALDGETVAGYTTVDRGDVSWTSHVAELRVLVGDAYRGIGLGRHLTQEAFQVAMDLGIEKMMAQMTIDQQGAITVFEEMGFRPEALLRDHVKDRQGVKHDLLILSQSVEQFHARRAATGLDRALAEYQTAT